MFLSHQQTIGTTAVQLELPTGAPGTDYRSGFSVVIKHNGAAAILIGSAGSGCCHTWVFAVGCGSGSNHCKGGCCWS